ncbi:uncharacterized protein BX663DRAFT_496678 [Cokeromyces recurvatus]|uniref:uncharacterized protein n=1 Tax=Cokeromyces recurvatus TaxID=90255 RepID=UPI00221EFB82|nr:uncharacterized protein BX663DRAFT_496678 [Cokeromyces recurvatus]KAI7906493.1 hypothetical protein BX663DRAFT_496678 [Cokeromyces recurvatus]
MQPLFERLISRQFSDSISAIAYCRELCAEFGFTVKQEASANRNIYVYCSREGLPDSQRNPKPTPQRKRPSKRCDCRWRVVLSENEQGIWIFRRSMNPNASDHNHEMMSPDEMEKPWPPVVTELINKLAGEMDETNKIRERIKQEFPYIIWNERRFYNRLTEARKRIKYMIAVKNARTLLPLSSRLCSIVAHNKAWVDTVTNDLQRMLDQYLQLANIPTDSVDSLCDLQSNTIEPAEHSDSTIDKYEPVLNSTHQQDKDDIPSSPSKKRKASDRTTTNNNDTTAATTTTTTTTQKGYTKAIKGHESQKGVHKIHVPSYTIQVPIPPSRSASIKKRVNNSGSSPILLENHRHPIHQQSGASTSLFSFTSPSSSTSSSSSSVPLQQQRFSIAPPPPQHHVSQRMSSPQPVHDFVISSSGHYHHPSQHQDNPNTDYNTQSSTTTTTTTTANSSSFVPYTISHPSAFTTTSSSELPYDDSFEAGRSVIQSGQQQEDPRLITHHNYFITVKEESSSREKEHEAILRQNHHIHRNSTHFNTGYALPMIQSMEDSAIKEGNHWN